MQRPSRLVLDVDAEAGAVSIEADERGGMFGSAGVVAVSAGIALLLVAVAFGSSVLRTRRDHRHAPLSEDPAAGRAMSISDGDRPR